MGIESPMITDSMGKIFDKFYELPNGCICCSAKEDLQTAIEYLISNEKYELDFILVETNGLADPSSTIKSFWLNEELKFPVKLRLIYSLVAAHTFHKYIHDNEIFLKQLIFADLILINHIDKVTEDQITEIEQKIQAINPTSLIRKTKFSQIDLNELFNFEGFVTQLKDLEDLSKLKISGDDDEDNDHHHHPDQAIQYLILEFKNELFDEKLLEQNIAYLLWENPDESKIMRIKGIFPVISSPFKYSIQGVDDIFEIKASEVEWKDQPKNSKFLLIGKNLRKDAMMDIFHKSIVKIKE